MYAVNKPKDTGKHYNKLYYKLWVKTLNIQEYSKIKQGVEVVTSSSERLTASTSSYLQYLKHRRKLIITTSA